ncbi:fucose 4-O-acetylase-like acetyltransferase [Rhodobacter aestuarii]|uniref:Fucose 4-O-acetylase n=2 Tax=Rhodobacter aestuarii TaxID=453582 RepID=A0A1N7QEX0_9RHOB|nr:acyltransferase family protein [Rhodobacter aestuarii]PTV93509.1 fucose 4-O-acetylase-like acetyltransferase [Rhodobacter aestuarii]SIT21421.1 Fucose 4-O-acetylase [Rhodobacter aestuarii]
MAPSTPADARDSGIDFLKGVLIVLMIYGHVGHIGTLRDIQLELVGWIYSFHMPAFLVVSGFFFFDRVKGKAITTPLLRRLIVPYMVFEPLYLLGLLISARIGLPTSNEAASDARSFIFSVFVQPIGAFWFVHALIVIQLSFAVSRAASRKLFEDDRIVWFGAVLLLGGAVQLGIVRQSAPAFFLIGLTIAALKQDVKQNIWLSILAIATCLILNHSGLKEFSFLQIAWVLGIIGVFTNLAAILPNMIVRLFAFIGRNTLILLITHAFFVVAMKPLAARFLGIDPTGLLFTLTTVSLACIGGVASSRALDALRLSSALFGTKRLYAPF